MSKVAIVTGASSGIGEACAAALAARGWRVFGAQRSGPSGATGAISPVMLDVTSDESVAAAVASVLGAAGRIDLLVNNAGYAVMGAIEDTSIDEARAQLETNFFGVLRMCRAVAPVMRGQGSGMIVNISSLAGLLGLPFSGLYSASKFAVEGLSESLRHELRPFGVTVAMIEPGDIATNLPANRRMVAAATDASPYAAALARMKTAQDADEAKAPPPDLVVRQLLKIVDQRHPPLRSVAGGAGQTIVVPLKRFLPQRLFERVLRLATGI